MSAAHYALAVLENGRGHYADALVAAREASELESFAVATWVLPELVEAAVRSGEEEVAAAAADRLAASALASGTDWALGMLERSRALVSELRTAEDLYKSSIEHLRRSRVAPQLARARLVYGEWLRRRRRRREARKHLHLAYTAFVAMGAEAFATRAAIELAATGEQVQPLPVERGGGVLTSQEARIARLATDGATNREIAAQLFISPRTVEYHLHKVFAKLGIGSRAQLAMKLLDERLRN